MSVYYPNSDFNCQNAHGQPLVIHDIGAGVQEEDRLFEFKITGHYRIKIPVPAKRR
jgi:uncharacterized protein YijF (DUF1287 family)